MGLRDQPHPGRPSLSSEEDRTWLERELDGAPHQVRALPSRFLERNGIQASLDTLKRWFSRKVRFADLHMDNVPARPFRRVGVDALSAAPQGSARPGSVRGSLADSGRLPRARGVGRDRCVLSGRGWVRTSPCVPYAWQRRGKPAPCRDRRRIQTHNGLKARFTECRAEK
jgi:hypothetical protein